MFNTLHKFEDKDFFKKHSNKNNGYKIEYSFPNN